MKSKSNCIIVLASCLVATLLSPLAFANQNSGLDLTFSVQNAHLQTTANTNIRNHSIKKSRNENASGSFALKRLLNVSAKQSVTYRATQLIHTSLPQGISKAQ